MTDEEQAIQDIRAMSEYKNGTRIAFIEAPEDTTPAFEQRSHTDVLLAVDRLAHGWISELARIREQTAVLERMVISQAAKVKEELTRMYMLGKQSMHEAERLGQINANIHDEIERMMTEREDEQPN